MNEQREHILAIDPATKCGWAHSCGISGVWDLSVRRDESGGMRLLRLRGKLREVYRTNPFSVLVFEAARNAAPGMQGALVVQASLQSVLVVFAEDHKINYRGYSPKSIKVHATGSGNANKERMINTAKEKFGDVIDDNQADALWLLDLAATDLEMPLFENPKPF